MRLDVPVAFTQFTQCIRPPAFYRVGANWNNVEQGAEIRAMKISETVFATNTEKKAITGETGIFMKCPE